MLRARSKRYLTRLDNFPVFSHFPSVDIGSGGKPIVFAISI